MTKNTTLKDYIHRYSILLVLLIISLFFGCEERGDTGYSTSSHTRSSSPAKNPPFNAPVVPMPYNGHVERFHYTESIAPLEIKTRSGSGNYYVKLVGWNTKQTVLTVFIHEGRTVTLDVPLGSYEMRYAVGKTWYGEIHLFGPETACSRADDCFNFTKVGQQVSGYTVELYLQAHGNLDTEPIPVSQF